MTDTTEVKRFEPYTDEGNREGYGHMEMCEGGVWVRASDYDALAAKLAAAELRARYETDIAQQALDQMRAAEAKLAKCQAAQHYTYIGKDGKPVLARDLEARAEQLEAKLAELGAERDHWETVAIARQAKQQAAEARIAHLENHIEGVAKDTHKIMVAYATAHAAVLGVAQTLEDAYWSREVTPTAAELARIQTGDKE